MNDDNPIGMALAALRDKDTRAKALAAILGAFVAGAIVAAFCLHGILTDKGCSATISFGAAFWAGMLALIVLGMILFAGGFILYGGLHLPGFISKHLETRKQPWYQEEKRRRRESRDPLMTRIGEHFAEHWKRWVAVPFFVGGLVLFAYVLAYAAWLAFC